MINSIDLQKLRNGEFIRFLKNFTSFIQEANPAALQVSNEFSALQTQVTDAGALFNIATGSAITGELEALDKQRDAALTGIKFLVQGHSYNTDPAVAQQAQVLLVHLLGFGDVVDDSYQSETESIDKIIADWNTVPELQAAIAALNLTAWRDTLQTANTNFDDNYKKRSKASGLADAQSLKTKRLEVNAVYYKLRDRLNAHEELSDGDALYVNLSKSINGLVQDYNEMLARRGGSNGDDAAPTA